MDNDKEQIDRMKNATAMINATNIVIAMLAHGGLTTGPSAAAIAADYYATVFAAVRKSLE
jgi:hypothetical protein